MFEEVRKSLKEVIDIADKCPEKYQNKCFEVLLEAIVREEPVRGHTLALPKPPIHEGTPFFVQNDIKDEQWQSIFHHEGNSYSIIVKDLNEKSISQRQIKLGLLLGIKNLLESNDPTFTKDSLIEICKLYSAYDPKNFAFHMKHNKNLFLTKTDGWTLTMPGQKQAAEVIKDLA